MTCSLQTNLCMTGEVQRDGGAFLPGPNCSSPGASLPRGKWCGFGVPGGHDSRCRMQHRMSSRRSTVNFSFSSRKNVPFNTTQTCELGKADNDDGAANDNSHHSDHDYNCCTRIKRQSIEDVWQSQTKDSVYL